MSVEAIAEQSADLMEANASGFVEKALTIFPGMLEASRNGNCARLRELGDEAYGLLAVEFPLAAEALRWQARAGAGEEIPAAVTQEDVSACVRSELGPYIGEEKFAWLFSTIARMAFQNLDEVRAFCAEFREQMENNEGRLLKVLEQLHAQDLAVEEN